MKSWGPFRASIDAAWLIEAVWVDECDWTSFIALISTFGPPP